MTQRLCNVSGLAWLRQALIDKYSNVSLLRKHDRLVFRPSGGGGDEEKIAKSPEDLGIKLEM